MPKKANIQVILESFEDKTIVLDEDQQKYRKRLLAVMDLKLKDLYVQDYELYKSLKKDYPYITFPQVCNDISIVERMIANEKDPSGDPIKTWNRYFIAETTKKAIKLAEDKGDGYTMAYAANILGKHHLTDKEDINIPNWDDIVPFVPEITSDVRTLGIEPIKELDQLRAKLEKKYGYNKAVDVEYTTVDNEETEN